MRTTLFRRSASGKMRSWAIEVDGPCITTFGGDTSGLLHVTSERFCVGKNLGKSNETTDEEQALREANATIAVRRKEGWLDSLEAAEKTTTSDEKVMLASNLKTNPELVQYPCDGQFKLNGMRNDARLVGGTIRHMSRRGNEILTLPDAITEELFTLLTTYNRLHPTRIVRTDGELYVHGMFLQQIISLVKNPRVLSRDRLAYHIYDIISDDPWEERREMLNALRGIVQDLELTRVVIVDTKPISGRRQHEELFRQAKAEGYEGIMLRDLAASYYHSQTESDRPACLIKDKGAMDSDEFLVVGCETDIRGGAVPICTTGTHTFKATLEGTSEWRNKVKRQFEQDFKNKYLTVRFYGKSKDGVPQDPVGEAFRDYE